MMNMKISRLLILSLILLTCISFANAESISGYITDENDNALSSVTISDNASIGSTTTNTSGYYYIDGYTNLTTYVLTASKITHIDNTLSVDVDGNITNANISITEKSSLYEIFQLMKNLVDNVSTIIGLVIVGVTITIVIGIGLFVQNLLNKAMK